jgi:hypothetical protein
VALRSRDDPLRSFFFVRDSRFSNTHEDFTMFMAEVDLGGGRKKAKKKAKKTAKKKKR